MTSYDTVTDALKGLKLRGFAVDFNIAFDKIICSNNETVLNPHEFEIVEVYRFEGNSDPADEAVVYAIESNKGHKGVLVNGYGPSSESMSSEMAKKLHFHTH
jgi:hypothetical protein